MGALLFGLSQWGQGTNKRIRCVFGGLCPHVVLLAQAGGGGPRSKLTSFCTMSISWIRIILLPLVGLCAFAGWGWSDDMYLEALVDPEPLDLVELWRMGDSEEDDALFRKINRIAVDSRGNVYVAEYYHPSVRVFSSTGDLIREIGRGGRGPGEFGNPVDVVIGKADTVFVWDKSPSMRRITVFSPYDYDVVTTLAVHDELALSFPDRLVGVVQEGFLLSHRTTFYLDERQGMKLDSPRFVDVYLANRRGETLERRLAHVRDRTMIATRSWGGASVLIMPFTRLPRITVNSSGLLYSGYSDSIAIAVQSADGETQRVIRWTHDPEPVTSHDVNAYFSTRSKGYRKAAQEAGIPDTKPAFQTFVVDDRDRVWVQLNAALEATVATCVILDATGTEVDRVELPAHLRLELIRGDRAYGVLEKHGEAPVLVAYAIK